VRRDCVRSHVCVDKALLSAIVIIELRKHEVVLPAKPIISALNGKSYKTAACSYSPFVL
jgi:hypothetical protein